MPDAPAVPDGAARLVMVALALDAAFLLWLAHHGTERHWAFFASTSHIIAWYTLAIAPPLIVALLLCRLEHVLAWAIGLGAALVLLPLAVYTGSQCDLRAPLSCFYVAPPYVIAIVLALGLLLPFAQVLTGGRRAQSWYVAVFATYWGHAVTLGSVALFVGLGWLILWLWAALFALVGLHGLERLIAKPLFIHLASGLFVGAGLAYGRMQPLAMQGVLRLCFSGARLVLLCLAPLVLAFLVALAFTGLEPLWATGRGTMLLLAVVAMVTSQLGLVYGTGGGPCPYGRRARFLVEAALVALPVYAGLAAIGLTLRVQQHGLSPMRLWAALTTAVAMALALAGAVSVFHRRGSWLAPLGRWIMVIMLALAVVLLLTQSPLLDWRRLSVASQMDRLRRGVVTMEKLDLHALARLARPGREALLALKGDPRAKALGLTGKIEALLAFREPEAKTIAIPLQPSMFAVIPSGKVLPQRLLAVIGALRAAGQEGGRWWITSDLLRVIERCTPDTCQFLAANFDDDPGDEWVLVQDECRSAYVEWLLFDDSSNGYLLLGSMRSNQWSCLSVKPEEIAKAFQEGRYQVRSPRFKELWLDGKKLKLILPED